MYTEVSATVMVLAIISNKGLWVNTGVIKAVAKSWMNQMAQFWH
jgi:hypothetical protein